MFGDLRRLAEEWVLPISPTHRRPQLFDATHPHYGGYMGIRVPPALITEMKRADLMVAIGERLTDSVSQSYTFPAAPQPQLPLVHVWPDANEVGRVWRPELGIAADPHEVVKALLKRGAPAVPRSAAVGLPDCTRSIASCWRRNGSRRRTASISPPLSARWTSTWRRMPR